VRMGDMANGVPSTPHVGSAAARRRSERASTLSVCHRDAVERETLLALGRKRFEQRRNSRKLAVE
jgi:hypothetical protein